MSSCLSTKVLERKPLPYFTSKVWLGWQATEKNPANLFSYFEPGPGQPGICYRIHGNSQPSVEDHLTEFLKPEVPLAQQDIKLLLGKNIVLNFCVWNKNGIVRNDFI